MSNLDLLYSDVEDDLRDSVRSVLRDRCSHDDVAAMYDSAPGPRDLWRTLAEDLGLAGLLVPEELGGAGASAREAAVVQEELGSAVAPVPFLTSAVIASSLLVDAGSPFVSDLASGQLTAALVVALSTPPDGELPRLVDPDGGVGGTVRSVAGAVGADILLVPVADHAGVEVRALRASDAEVRPVSSLDMSRQVADVILEDVAGEVIVSGASGEAAVRRALLSGAAMLASEQVGVARWCLETTLAHLRERRQFGRVLGSYQALKHRLADLYVEVESATAAARYAAATIAAGNADVRIAVAVAQAYCSGVAVHAAEEAVQMHGGIGMTWEHPLHLYLKRAKADQIALGDAGHHRSQLARLVDLPAPVRTT